MFAVVGCNETLDSVSHLTTAILPTLQRSTPDPRCHKKSTHAFHFCRAHYLSIYLFKGLPLPVRASSSISPFGRAYKCHFGLDSTTALEPNKKSSHGGFGGVEQTCCFISTPGKCWFKKKPCVTLLIPSATSKSSCDDCMGRLNATLGTLSVERSCLFMQTFRMLSGVMAICMLQYLQSKKFFALNANFYHSKALGERVETMMILWQEEGV